MKMGGCTCQVFFALRLIETLENIKKLASAACPLLCALRLPATMARRVQVRGSSEAPAAVDLPCAAPDEMAMKAWQSTGKKTLQNMK